MSLSKCWFSNICLHILKRAVPFFSPITDLFTVLISMIKRSIKYELSGMFLGRFPRKSVRRILGRMIRLRSRVSGQGKVDQEFDKLLSGFPVALRDWPNPVHLNSFKSGNTKWGSITVPLTSCLAGLESAV